VTELSYFCYISRKKIDDLYEQLDPKAAYEFSESHSKTVDINVSSTANWGIGHIVSLFRVGGTYGRKGVIQRDSKIKIGYMEKLRTVLASLAEQSAIRPLGESVSTEATQILYYHYTGLFTVKSRLGRIPQPDCDGVVTLESNFGKRTLLLDVSLRYFSEGPLPDGRFLLHSGNHRFFEGDISLTMTCVFVLLEATPKRIVGSPLFLKLAYDHSGRGFLSL